MLFSDQFNIQIDGSEDWFNPILDDDTLLFVDPFLIYMDNKHEFFGGYDKIMEFFSTVFMDAATTPRNMGSPRLNVLTTRVVFKEPKEACLGYSIGSVNGAGSGSGFAKIIISAVYDSIAAGIEDLTHFEELGIFSSNIKEDRISDITINILKEQFIAYTQRICADLGIACENLPCRVYDTRIGRWTNRYYQLPKNPFNNGPVILVPKRFLASINALNATDFNDYCWEQYDESITDQFNVDLKSKMDKTLIVQMARSNPTWVSSYMDFKESQRNAHPYDLELDPSGVYNWHKATEHFAQQNPIGLSIVDQASYKLFLDEIARLFTLFIEEYEGYLLLVDHASRPKREKAAQLLLYGLIKQYCAEIKCKIAIKDAGKGIVNFIFSPSIERRALMEIKYVKNSGMLRTFQTFLEKVGNGDEEILGYYFVVGFKQADLQKGLDAEDDVLQLAADHNFTIKYKLVDATLET